MKINMLTQELLTAIQSVKEEPCISLYMPTHKTHPDNVQDPIRFKNLISEIWQSLIQEHSEKDIKALLDPFESLMGENDFWNHTADGIAVFGATNYFETVQLQIPVKEMVVVANSFHTKPLRHYLQSTDRYQILGLTRDSVRLFEGNRHSLIEVELPADFPKTMSEALGTELTEKHSTVASYGGVSGDSANMHHGHGGKKDEIDNDTERFFRVVAAAVYDEYSKPTGLPLMLAALPEHHAVFQKVNKNPLLQIQKIQIDPQSISIDKLTKLAWDNMEIVHREMLEQMTNQFKQAQAHGKGSESLEEVTQAAASGRVDTVFIEENKIIAGQIEKSTAGMITSGDIGDPATDDLLDDLGELVIKQGGKVIVLPLESMPTDKGIAAIYRY